jgi:hypothetical protein
MRIDFEGSSSEFLSGRQDLGRNAVDIRISGAVIHNAGTQAEFRVQCRIGEVDMTAGDDSPQDVRVQLIEFDLRQIAIAYVSKAHGTEFNRCQQLQFRRIGNRSAQSLGVQQVFLDGLP